MNPLSIDLLVVSKPFGSSVVCSRCHVMWGRLVQSSLPCDLMTVSHYGPRCVRRRSRLDPFDLPSPHCAHAAAGRNPGPVVESPLASGSCCRTVVESRGHGMVGSLNHLVVRRIPGTVCVVGNAPWAAVTQSYLLYHAHARAHAPHVKLQMLVVVTYTGNK